MKKIFTFLLALMTSVGLSWAATDDSGSCGANVTYSFNGATGAMTITGTGPMTDFANKSDAPWDSYRTSITSVTITDGVTSVGKSSFGQCTSLTTVTIGNDVETIGEWAFNDCGEQFTSLTLGNSIRTIGNYAFLFGKGITGFTLPSTLETIGDYAFCQNRAITTLTIPSNVTSIGKLAFYNCNALTSITTEATTPPTLKETVFDGVPTSIPLNVPNGSVAAYEAAAQWTDFDIQGYDPAPTPANVCGDGLTWELNGGVLTISYDGVGTGEMYDFGYEYDQNPVNVAPWKENKSEITTVIVGDGVKSIGNYAFNDLIEIFTAVTIANSVERIGVFAFTNAEEITEITLPSSLKTIDEQGFANCGFTSITIPSGVTSIGYKAFSWCRNLTSLTCEATTPPTLDESVFYKIRSTTSSISSIPLYVPSASVTAYEAAAQWNAFDIQGYDPAPTPASSVTAARFVYNYDCQRSPGYPQQGSPCNLSGFKDPYEGYKGSRNGNIALGPWKLEFVAYYTPSNNYDCASQVNSAVNEYYMGMSSEEKEAKKLEVPIFRLLQYNLTAREYQHATYGIVCAYAGEANAQDHAALFISSNDYGCFLSGHQHTTSFALTCENDLTTGFAALVDAASASDPYYDVVWPVIVSIDAIGPVELSEHCKYYIEGSRAAYDALTDEQKAQVTNYSTLTDAETQWAALAAAAQPYADGVIALINAIPNPVVYTQQCKDAIDAAQAAYDALTDGQKIFVSNYETLKNAPSDLINAAPYVHILFKANGNEKKVENVTFPKEFTEAEMTTILKELYGVEGDYDMYANSNSNADAVNIIPYEKWTISPFMGKVNVNGGLYKYDPQTGFDQIDFSLEISLELPPFGPAPTPTDEQVPTNADPENPSYHYSTFFHSTQNYKLSNDGTQAFIADLSNNELVLTEIAHGEQVIPANTAVILRKTGSADPVVLIPTEENGVSINPNDNSLEGVDAETTVTDIAGLTADNCYVLSGGSYDETVTGVGFYRIYGTTLLAHKAYVQYDGNPSSAPKRMRFIVAENQQPTGIEDTEAATTVTKRIENGTLYIIKDGKRYNAQGKVIIEN